MSLVSDKKRLTTLLDELRSGREAARDELCRMVYDELRVVAGQLARNQNGKTLQPTAIVNELMVRFLDQGTLESFTNRRSFFAVAIDAMKQILIDHYRARNCLKRGGDRQREPLDMVLETIETEARSDFAQLHLALEKLKSQNQRQHEVVQLRFFGGLTEEEAAEVLGVSRATVQRDWRVARAKLHVALTEEST